MLEIVDLIDLAVEVQRAKDRRQKFTLVESELHQTVPDVSAWLLAHDKEADEWQLWSADGKLDIAENPFGEEVFVQQLFYQQLPIDLNRDLGSKGSFFKYVDAANLLLLPIGQQDRFQYNLGVSSSEPLSLTDADTDRFKFIGSLLVKFALTTGAEKQSSHTETELSFDEQLQLVNQLALDLVDAASWKQAFKITCQTVSKLINSDQISMSVFDKKQTHWKLFDSNGEIVDEAANKKFPLENTHLQIVAKQNKVFCTGLADAETFPILQLIGASGYKSVMNAPLLQAKQVIGTLNILSTHTHAYSEHDQVIIQQIAALLSKTLEAIDLFKKTQQALANAQNKSHELALINSVIRQAAQTSTLFEALEVISENLSQIQGGDQVWVAMLDEEKEYLVIQSERYHDGKSISTIGLKSPAYDGSLNEHVLTTKQRVYVQDAQNDPFTAHMHDLMCELAVCSIAVFPVIVGDDVVGIVAVGCQSSEILFPEATLDLMDNIVSQTAATIQNSILLDKMQAAFVEIKVNQKELEFANQVVESSPIVLIRWVIREEAYYPEYISPNISQYGYTAEEIQSRRLHFSKIMPPEDYNATILEINQHVKDRTDDFTQEYRLRTKAGDLRWISDRKQIFWNEEGEIDYIQSTTLDITKQKEINKSLQLTQFAVDQSPQLVIWLDKKGKIIYANEMSNQLLGYTKSELETKTIFEISLETTPERYAQSWEEFAKLGNWNYVTVFKRKDGTQLEVEIDYGFFKYENEEFRMGYVKDISIRKEQERQLAENSLTLQKVLGQLQIVVDTIDYGVLFVDKDLSLIMANRKSREILGFTDELLEGSPTVTDLLNHNRHTGIYDAGEQSWQEYLDSRVNAIKIGDFDPKEVQLTNGKTIEYGVKNLEDGSRMLTYFDITDRKVAERQIQESEEQLREILSSIPVPLGITGASDQLLYYSNEAFDLLMGSYPEDTEKNRARLLNFYHNEDDRRIILEAIEDKGSISNFELQVSKLDESSFWAELSLQKIVYFGRDCILSSIYDISGRKESEQVIIAAKESAELAAQAKSDFLANMSHEIRTPMNGVIGMTSLLIETDLNQEQLNFVETIRSSGESLLTIINDILDFSKIESGQLEFERQPFHLRRSLEEALDLIAPQAHNKGLELLLLYDENAPEWIESDVTRIRQIVVNLLSNAVKFTTEGEVKLAVSSVTNPDGSYQIQFDVIDTGIGIPADRMNRLFRSFSQVDTSTTRKYGGTGLGLAISKRLSELMGGRMWVNSQLNVGSTFSFNILAYPAHVSRQSINGIVADFLLGKTVLIVDDNKANLRVMKSYCRRWGMNPQTVASGMEAILQIQRNAELFDVMMLDYDMPGMNGVEMLESLERLDVPVPPTILITSVGNREVKEKAKTMGVKTFMYKPIKIADLLMSLQQLLKAESEPLVVEPKTEKFDAELAQKYPLRILLAEDNVVNQKVAVRTLERLGYRADIVANGEEAVEAVLRQNYDLILMDVHMPEMDGLEASRQIKALLKNQKCPLIVALTAGILQSDRDKCVAAGMDMFLSKPFKIHQLSKLFESIGRKIQTN